MTAHGTAQENGKPQIVMFLKDLWVVRREQTKKNTKRHQRNSPTRTHLRQKSLNEIKRCWTLERVGHND